MCLMFSNDMLSVYMYELTDRFAGILTEFCFERGGHFLNGQIKKYRLGWVGKRNYAVFKFVNEMCKQVIRNKLSL